MFIGHFALAYAAKPLAPRVSLGTTFLAAQFLDLLWPTLLLMGAESVRLAPAGAAVPFVFEHYPISHSLLGAAGWGLLLGVLFFLLRGNARGAWIVGLLVVSHWLLDWIVHVPDLPIAPGMALKVGLGLWEAKVAALALELALFAACVYLYTRNTRPSDSIGRHAHVALVLFLLAIHAANLFGPPPTEVAAVAWVGQAQWLLVAWAFWVDAHRTPLPAPAPGGMRFA